MLNFETQHSISSNNMLSFWIHSIFSTTFSNFHHLFSFRFFSFISSFPRRLINSLSISLCSLQFLKTYFYNFGLSQVQTHQKTMVHMFTFTQARQENSLIELRPFCVTYIQNEHYVFSQSGNPTIHAVITLGSLNIV
jgi:hypothetical protein